MVFKFRGVLPFCFFFLNKNAGCIHAAHFLQVVLALTSLAHFLSQLLACKDFAHC